MSRCWYIVYLILSSSIDVTTLSTGPYKHLYTIRFNTSGLAEKHPNHAELFLHVHHHHSTAAQIRITSSHYQQPAVWQQHPQANGEDETAKKAQVLLRIALTSLTTGSLWKNDSILTLTVASTKPITMPSKNRHQTSVGLVLYMGGSPEAIDKLIKSPVIATSHRVMSKKETYSIGAAHKRSTGSTPCQLKKGLNIRFSEVKGGFERVLKPVVVDIGKCVGECPHFLHHLHNPSQHAEVRNLLAFREGSASDVTRASCVPTSFKPLPIVLYNDATKRATVETYNKMVATSCGCR